jgi:hypothetical protein
MLAEIDIFKCLREGDGSKKHPIKLAWGKNAGRKTWKPDEEPSNLQYVLLETFENLFFTIVGRVIDSDFGKEMILKQSGTAIPGLERSKSLITSNVSEKIIGQGFYIIFRELNRYTTIMNKFPGIDF